MTRAVLSIGSNIGDSFGHLQRCVAGLGEVVLAVSPVYRTAPWGGVEQDDFLNAVVIVADPGVDAVGWLDRAQQLERDADRVRDVRWGPRTLDVDLITVSRIAPACLRSVSTVAPACLRSVSTVAPACFRSVDEVRSDTERLTLPHPRAAERAFVLVPWRDVEPDALLPGHGPVAALIDALPVAEREGVSRCEDLILKPR